MRSIRMLTAALLATGGLVAVGVTSEAANAASTKDLTASHTKVMSHESFKLSGGMSTHAARTVKLQYRNHNSGAWTTKTSVTSNSGGTFSFFTSTSKTRYWRYYAPATASFAKITGNSLRVSVVSQSVTVEVIRQTQCHFGSSATDNVTVVYDFYPSRVGRTVDFGSTAIDSSDYEDSHGRVAFTFNPGTTNGTFDAAGTAQAYDGASSLNAKVVHYSITQCFFVPI